MKLARELEKRLERLVDGLSAAIFRGRIHPVDIANRLVREVDLQQSDGPLGPQILNRWTVALAPVDAQATTPDELARELTHVLDATAADRGWRTGGRVFVDVVIDAAARPGSIRCTGTSEPDDAGAWSRLLDVDQGRSYDVVDNRILIGRAEGSDIRIEHPEVSRRHAVLFREGGRAWIEDAGSANGTRVNGRAVSEAVALTPGDELSFGPATFSFRMS